MTFVIHPNIGDALILTNRHGMCHAIIVSGLHPTNPEKWFDAWLVMEGDIRTSTSPATMTRHKRLRNMRFDVWEWQIEVLNHPVEIRRMKEELETLEAAATKENPALGQAWSSVTNTPEQPLKKSVYD